MVGSPFLVAISMLPAFSGLLLRGGHLPAFRRRLGVRLVPRGDRRRRLRGGRAARGRRRGGRSQDLLDVGQRLDLGLEAVAFGLPVGDCLVR